MNEEKFNFLRQKLRHNDFLWEEVSLGTSRIEATRFCYGVRKKRWFKVCETGGYTGVVLKNQSFTTKQKNVVMEEEGYDFAILSDKRWVLIYKVKRNPKRKVITVGEYQCVLILDYLAWLQRKKGIVTSVRTVHNAIERGKLNAVTPSGYESVGAGRTKSKVVFIVMDEQAQSFKV